MSTSTARPAMSAPHLTAIPELFKAMPAWVLFKVLSRNGQWTKVPFQPSNIEAETDNPATWSTFAAVEKAYRGGGYDGIGLVRHGDLVFIDMDGCCVGPKPSWATKISQALTGFAYAEFSVSGSGIHILTRGKVPPGRRQWDDPDKDHTGYAFYDGNRYFTFTGDQLESSTEPKEATPIIAKLHAELFPQPRAVNGNGTRPVMPVTLSDSELIERARNAKDGALFSRLWAGNWQGEGYGSESEADLALCNKLAFWTGRDASRIDALFRLSGLMDEKWEKRVDYRERTIQLAIAGCHETYTPRPANTDRPVMAGEAAPPHMEAEPLPPQPESKAAETAEKLPPNLLSQPFNDYGNAHRVIAIHREEMRFCHASESWMHWQGGRWTGDEDGRARLHSQNTIAEFGKQALTTANAFAARFAASCLNSNRISNALREAAPHLAVTMKELDRDQFLFNCLNGTVELRTGNLREHRREDYITKLAPVKYDPSARSDLWERALEDWTGGDKELRDFLQRAVGYSLSGDTSEEVLFFVHGPARAGKSSFLEAIKATLGDYTKTADFDTFVQRKDSAVRSDIAELAGRRFVVSIEVDEGKRLAEGLVKMVTGGDTVTARFLYQERFEFIPQFKLWLAANHAPKVKDDDTAMWRRILRIPFENVIPKEQRDPTLKTRLKNTEEVGPAILAWAVEGFLRWQDDRLQVPEVVELATEAYRQDMDPLRQFFEDRCIFGNALKVTSALLHQEYENWCRENGEREINGKEFSQRLRDRKCTPDKAKISGKSASIWQGIGITCGEDES